MSPDIPVDWDLNSYDFSLPEKLIAQHPVPQRDHSRMMQLSKTTDPLLHKNFYDFPDCLPENAMLVLNNTKVLPARLLGNRPTGGKIEILLIEEKKTGLWQALAKPAKRIKSGEWLSFCDDQIQAKGVERIEDGSWLLEFENPDTLSQRLEKFGLLPLPPYIDRF